MSEFPAPVKIDTVSGGIVQFGNSLFISPKSASKSTHGSGSTNSGLHVTTITGQSTTTSVNADLLDQPIVQDN
ncbi:spore germination protein [Bacillus sp. ISL-40]|uniref:spore germination protein n=1 Tax=unclassified Bacillus (in: firmicutes) TaxID=185979 RepID=UPI001BE5E17B|nr:MULTISPECIES: spore germination protein [unclassified Bacillus (in: firmicutes)]MBT2699098.1 spore germination protein [Bacillus sp. ISL-40]MBT2743978.1 spore germination protein [Bacillus sp. ISL-77]